MSPENIEEFDAALVGAAPLEALLDPIVAAINDDVYAFMAAFRADLPAPDSHNDRERQAKSPERRKRGRQNEIDLGQLR